MSSSTGQFLTFTLVGVANTAIHLAAFVALIHVFGAPILAASAIGYCAGVLNSYVMNRIWTFRVKGKANIGEISRFLAVNLVSLGLNLAALTYFANCVGLQPEVAQILAIAISLVANFVGNRWWTFAGTPTGSAS